MIAVAFAIVSLTVFYWNMCCRPRLVVGMKARCWLSNDNIVFDGDATELLIFQHIYLLYLDFWYGSSTTPKWHQISRWFLIISPMPLRPGIATLRNVPGGFHRSKAGGTSSAFKYHPMGHGQPRAPGRMPILWRNGEIRGISNHRWIGINGYQRNKQKHVQRNVRLGAAAEAMHPFYYLASCLQFAFAKCIELHIIQTSSGKGIYLTVPTQICRYIAGSTFHRFGQLTKFHLCLLTSM